MPCTGGTGKLRLSHIFQKGLPQSSFILLIGAGEPVICLPSPESGREAYHSFLSCLVTEYFSGLPAPTNNALSFYKVREGLAFPPSTFTSSYDNNDKCSLPLFVSLHGLFTSATPVITIEGAGKE